MGGIFGSLISTSGALRAYDKSLSVIQNNVANVHTPGYVRQRLQLLPQNFSTKLELSGGVAAGALLSSRDAYIERAVWRQNSLSGRQSQTSLDLGQIEPVFQIGEGAGIPGSLNQFFNSVSSWSVNPNDPVARQVVLDRASATARSFNSAANALGEAQSNADRDIRDTVDAINDLAGQIRDINAERRTDRRKLEDPALEARVHATLEELSQYVDFNAIEQPDGSFTVLFGGQTPLVQGDRQTELRADFSNPEPAIVDDQGNDVTGQFSEGSLKGLLDTRNEKIPGYLSDLNRLAETFADRVNEVLGGGLDANASSPLVDLFTYDSGPGAAFTLGVTAIAPSELAAADPGAPGGNGNALRLGELANSTEIDDVSFQQFYGRLAAKAGRDLRDARDSAGLQEQLVTQVRELRQENSAVSLDEEAARLVEAQRAYQANAQLFQVLNTLTDTLLGILR
ncbi:MAG: flagellar hook-associated protein FlgK [Bryobacteraceae bacterium]|nr:flagellar hook-associated protein FlgK [Bryobacteraceae bacterium]